MQQIKNLHFHNTYGYNIYQCDDTLQGAPTHKFAWPLNEVIIWGHMTS